MSTATFTKIRPEDAVRMGVSPDTVVLRVEHEHAPGRRAAWVFYLDRKNAGHLHAQLGGAMRPEAKVATVVEAEEMEPT